MEITFLGQGLGNSKDTVGDILIKSFTDKSYFKFSCLVAFASQTGINGLYDCIEKAKEHIKKFNIFIGVDHKGTSKEALETLLELNIGTKIFHTLQHITFHPKIYLFEGSDKCRIIVGSANLTLQGLIQNIEASLMIDCDVPDDFSGVCPKYQIYDYFSSFFKGNNKNVQTLTSELIEKFVKKGIVPDETERTKIHDKELQSASAEEKDEEIEELKKLFPPIEIPKFPEGFNIKRPPKHEVPIEKTPTQHTEGGKGALIWRKSNLPQSDVLYEPSGSDTHATGCLRLTQARWRINNIPINQTSYFRNDLFGNFEWRVVRESPFVEGTTVLFDITILGNNIGQHQLNIRHKPSGEADQANYTTSLHWGEIRNRIIENDLRGKTLSLYAPPEGQSEPFFIVITDETRRLMPITDFL